MKLTKLQQRALLSVFKRGPQYSRLDRFHQKPLTYLQFRRLATPLLAGGGCIMIPWNGMFLGIETDGYTHS